MGSWGMSNGEVGNGTTPKAPTPDLGNGISFEIDHLSHDSPSLVSPYFPISVSPEVRNLSVQPRSLMSECRGIRGGRDVGNRPLESSVGNGEVGNGQLEDGTMRSGGWWKLRDWGGREWSSSWFVSQRQEVLFSIPVPKTATIWPDNSWAVFSVELAFGVTPLQSTICRNGHCALHTRYPTGSKSDHATIS